MIYININIYDKYMMINKIGNFCKIVWGFKIKSESLISETAGRRALKTKFSPLASRIPVCHVFDEEKNVF